MFTGSGMPMRFADLDGSMIDVYQAATQMTDESEQTYPFTIDSLLDKALGPEGYYGVFTANMHTDSASQRGLGRDRRLGAVARRPGRLRPPDAAVARRPQRLLLRRDLLERQHAQLHHRPVGASATGLRAMVPTTSSVGALTGVEAERRPDRHHHPDDQGRRVRVLRRHRRQLRGDLRRRQHRADDLQRRRLGPRGRHRRHHLGHRRGLHLAGRLRHRPEQPRTRTRSMPGAGHLPQRPPHRPGSEHHLPLPGDVRRRRDARANSSTSPAPPAAPASFTTPSASFTDTTVSDFGAGTPDANTYISETGNGEVILKPTEGQEFSGGRAAGRLVELDLGEPGRRGRRHATVSGGALHVDGAMAGTTATFAPGHSLEFAATFGAATFQHVAFTDNFTSAWAMFSTRGSTSQLYASTNNAVGDPADTRSGFPASTSAPSTRYRIQWDAGQVQYYIDGNLVHTASATFGPNLNVAASDFNSGGPGLSVDWLHLSPYPAAGTFLSRVFDAGQAADWGALSWNANAPPGTLQISVRTGDTPTPDGSWSAFTPINTSGGDIPGNSRYVQYRAQLGSSDPNQTPTLSDVSIAYTTRGRHDGADDHAEDAGAERHQRPTEHQRRRPVQRADEPSDDRQLDRAAAKAGRGQRRAGERQLRGEHGDDRSERRPGSERGLQRHGRGHRRRTPAGTPRGGRQLELHHRGSELRLHRHHRLRLQRRHPRRQHLRLRDRATAR